MNTLFQGKIIEVIQDGKREFARRSPGTRLIIVDLEKKQILLTQEYREELKAWDYRLPGGKVFDTLIEYNNYLKDGRNIIEAATVAAKKEAEEEAGIQVDNIHHFYTSVCGATVVWDLYYFVVDEFTVLPSQKLEDGEQIKVKWVSLDEAKQLSISGQMSEDRSVAVLLRYLEQ
jgi:ADP-ribose pyrophosphatase